MFRRKYSLAGLVVFGMLATLVCVAPANASAGQMSNRKATSSGGPSQLPDIETKMRLARADKAFAETKEAADTLVRLATDLSARVLETGAVSSDDRKILERVRKLAKKVRAEWGGGGDPEAAQERPTQKDAAETLGARAKALREEIDKSSRYELNYRIVNLTGDIMLLSDALRIGVSR